MRFAALPLFVISLYAQAPSHIPFRCDAEELETAGVTCSPAQPCPVYLELAAIEPVGGKIFASGNLHTAEATLASILLASDDGGRTWSEPITRYRSAGLDQIQFIDFETGWVAGQMLQGKPHDPFLVVTRDGGKSFQYRPVFDEPRTGIVQQFWFESRKQGQLLIDRMQATETGARHELYESMTGGDSWGLKQVSASPLTIKRVHGEENPDWRLRADAASKSYRIEHRENGTWRAVAIFPIRVAECKSAAETALPEPPPEPDDTKPNVLTAPARPRTAPTLKKKP